MPLRIIPHQPPQILLQLIIFHHTHFRLLINLRRNLLRKPLHYKTCHTQNLYFLLQQEEQTSATEERMNRFDDVVNNAQNFIHHITARKAATIKCTPCNYVIPAPTEHRATKNPFITFILAHYIHKHFKQTCPFCGVQLLGQTSKMASIINTHLITKDCGPILIQLYEPIFHDILQKLNS